MWRQEAYTVTNKSEYIREGYALRKALRGLMEVQETGAPNENIVENHLNIALLNVF